MITYDWNCKTVDAYVEKNGNSDVAYNIHWKVSGTKENGEEVYTYKIIGTQQLETKEIVNFIPFDQVTNAQLVEWTQTAMGVEQVSDIEHSISQSIETLINPVSKTITAKD
tara:strand:+ start:1690 stop:2022 length:333 start_codon:yes stop_codon:yes gene_type:complete